MGLVARGAVGRIAIQCRVANRAVRNPSATAERAVADNPQKGA